MNKIIVLDDSLVSKIAAGEVVERPASVVKELVENSIDAGAKMISIEVKDGGKKLIKVTDDGSGMSADDAKLSVERHSTSKIKSAEDLFNIRTLGFRGEALPSIAGISKFELVTSDGKSTGTKLVIEGSKLMNESKIGCPPGTSVTVEDLFFNTPARLKFQKGKATELSHVVDIVTKFMLSRPRISFKLRSDGEEMLSSLGTGNLIDAVASVYGTDMAKTMLEIKGRGGKRPACRQAWDKWGKRICYPAGNNKVRQIWRIVLCERKVREERIIIKSIGGTIQDTYTQRQISDRSIAR